MKYDKKQKGGKILGKGRDGCVTDATILCSTKLNSDNYKDKVSKVIDISNADSYSLKMFVDEFNSGQIFRNYDKKGQHFLPGLEMCYKKYHELTDEQKEDMYNCAYNTDDFESLYLNIILQKGLSFPKVLSNLKEIDILKSIAYLLIGAKKSIYDLNVLLLDIKPDNLLFASNKNYTYPVFIDFSDDFVIKNIRDLDTFINGFSSYYPYWTLEMLIVFIEKLILKNDRKKITDLLNKIKKYRGIDLTQNNKSIQLVIENISKKLLNRRMNADELDQFYEKQFVYSIGISFLETVSKLQVNNNLMQKIKNLLSHMTNENYFKRPGLDSTLVTILNVLSKEGVQLKYIEDYMVKNSTQSSRKASIVASIPSIANLTTEKTDSYTSKSISDIVDMIVSDKKKEIKKRSNVTMKNSKIGYNLNEIKEQDLKLMKKKELVNIIDQFKSKYCKTNIQKMKKSDLIQNIKLISPNEKNLNNYTVSGLKTLYKGLKKQKCSINKNDKKINLINFIKKEINN